MIKIGNIDIPSPLALAPMAGVCDLAFRTVCREQGAGLTVTEMVSSKGLYYGDKKTSALLRIGSGEHPSAAQIFGSDPECMAAAAKLALELSGADIIDINMGCPVGKIVKSGDGSALMRTPELARDIISAVSSAVPCPVTVKIRKGWDGGSVNAPEFAAMAESAGAAAIAVHGRTRTQLYSGTADWDVIKRVKDAVSVPVIANGDVFTPEDAVRIVKHTGADMVMIGRGAFGDPWLFRRALCALNGQPVPERPPLSERIETARRQFYMALEDKGEHIACLEARRYYAWYLHGVPYSGHFREQISHISCREDVDRITEGIKRELR